MPRPCLDPRHVARRQQTFTGRVIISVTDPWLARIEDGYGDCSELTLQQLAADDFDLGFDDILAQLGDPPAVRLMHLWSVNETRNQHEAADLGNSVKCLNAFFAIELYGRTLPELRRAAALFGQNPNVATAFVEPTVRQASPDAATPDSETEGKQGYLYGDHSVGSSKSGVNAHAVWSHYNGSGVHLVPVDMGYKLEHKDLPKGIAFADATMSNTLLGHGTRVLGVVAALDDGPGIVGISPGLTLDWVASADNPPDRWDIPNAIASAMSKLPQPGGVLLLELDTPTSVTEDIPDPPTVSGLPLEVVEPWQIAIMNATGVGIAVIEPAGNPSESATNFNLDLEGFSPTSGAKISLDPTDTSYFTDTKAIMVGACGSTPIADDEHEILKYHWYGARIDCFAWGESVYTTSCYDGIGPNKCDPDPGVQADYYEPAFGYTSAASSIIAGVVVLIQQMYQAANGGVPAWPEDIRNILRDVGRGTPVKLFGKVDMSGRAMPDLRKIASSLDAYPDVFVRDDFSDVGAVPSPKVSMSPDIFVKTDSTMLPEYGDRTAHISNDNIVVGGNNYIFLRVANLSLGAPAENVEATVYWADATTMLIPANWNLIGTYGLPNVPAGGNIVVQLPSWDGAGLQPGAHACFIAVLHQPQDPSPALAPNLVDWAGFLSFIGSSNNVAWRNFNVAFTNGFGGNGAPAPDDAWAGDAFEMQGAPDAPMAFDFEVQLEEIPEEVRLYWRMPKKAAEALARGYADRLETFECDDNAVVVLPLTGKMTFEGIRLPRAARIKMELGVFAPEDLAFAPGRVAFIQRLECLEVGRITWEIQPARVA